MKAMILAAGLGTRLRPLTNDRPKALVELGGRTLLEITISRLRAFGVDEIIVNVHHFAEKVSEYLRAQKNFGMRIEVSREEVLLDTGGGLKEASWFFLEDKARLDEPFFLHNVDVLSRIDLAAMVDTHREKKALVTLAVQERASSRLLLFDSGMRLCGRANGREAGAKSGKGLERRDGSEALAFCGIHVISPRLLPMLTEEGAFPIVDAYVRIASEGGSVAGFRADEYYWRDLGRAADLEQASLDLQTEIPEA